MTISLSESVLRILASSLPEFLGSVMAAFVIAAVSWSAWKARERSRTRRVAALRPDRETDDVEHRPTA